MRRTKIVATIGPASRDRPVLERMIRAGVNVLRLNFSHGTHEEHAQVIECAREIAERLGHPLALLQDLSGPKIRTGKVRGDEIQLEAGAHIAVTTDTSVEGTPDLIATTYEALPRDVVEGDRILLDDGNLSLRVVETLSGRVECKVVDGGPLRSNKGMNLPGVKLSVPALTEKDRADLAFGLERGVDYVALSFVRRAADIEEIKELIASLGHDVPVIAKVEKPEAVENLAAILEVTDGVMVARGDLGVELGTEEVPTVQKRIIAAANAAGRVVITATQMLESMMTNPRPTRAEASDVANAILDGTDAVMLSGETAVGAYPVASVQAMTRIAREIESSGAMSKGPRYDALSTADVRGGASPREHAVASATIAAATSLEAPAIIVITRSGFSARLVSSYRPPVPIFAVCTDPATASQLSAVWGVRPLLAQEAEVSYEALTQYGKQIVVDTGVGRPGQTVVVTAGFPFHQSGSTNTLRVEQL